MSVERNELKQVLGCYTTETLTYIHIVREFTEFSSKWILKRETELEMMMDIKDRLDKIDLKMSHFTEAEDKGKAFGEYMKSKFSLMTADRRCEELKEELTELLKAVVDSLEKLDFFLDAVEKLAVTSLHVFTENQMLNLPKSVSLDYIQVVVMAAKLICPLLLEFKRDAKCFFTPILQNVEVLSYQLDKYIQTAKDICEKFEKSCFSDFSLTGVQETVVDLDGNLPEENIHRMLDHINQLNKIRMDPHFRMAFLFQQEIGQRFVKEFDERQPKMLDFLTQLEDTAVELHRMSTGAKISSVVGSSVGAVGGVLSIVGLALIPFTAGVSLALTMTGVGMGVTSGVNSLVTTATEIGVNATQQKKAGEVFQSFMEDVQNLQDCVDEAISQTISKLDASRLEMILGVGRTLCSAGAVAKGIDSLVDAASAVKVLKSEQLASGVAKVGAQEGKALGSISRVASDIPDMSQAAAKSSLALSKSARAGLIAVNALFIGLDVFIICKDSISLAKGSKSEMAEFIRVRAALWSSEMDSWQKIRNSLQEGLPTAKKKEALLETPFYQEMEAEEEKETEKKVLHEEEKE